MIKKSTRISQNKYIKILMTVFILLIFTKIDFRFYEYPPGLIVDDAEYYYHVQTIVQDFDLDYSNQMAGAEYRNLNKLNDFPVPVHPIGSGIFAAPFIFISNFLSNIVNLDSVVSLNYYIYSLVPIIYLYLSAKMLFKIFSSKKIKTDFLYLIILCLGSGVSYFAFERFSMSHVYEFFGQVLIFYFIFKFENTDQNSKKNFLLFLIPIFLFLVFSIRWSNYHVFISPLIYAIVFNKKLIKDFLSVYFFSGILAGALIYYFISYQLYGVLTLNPSDLFLQVENRLTYNYERFFQIDLFFENIKLIWKSLMVILFGYEFGILYFSPIIFIGLLSFFIFLYKRKFILSFSIFIVSFFPLMGIVVLQNTGYSYGYRYLYSLTPIYLLFLFKFLNKNRLIKQYLIIFSIFSIISQVFFEASQQSILYSEYVVNSFGQETKFVNPDYLIGLLKSFVIFDSYLNVIFTSFFGIIVIKILGYITYPLDFINNFRAQDENIIRLVDNAESISIFFLLVLLSLFVYIGSDIFKR